MASLRDTITKAAGAIGGFLTGGSTGRGVSDYMSGQDSKPLWPPLSERPRLQRYERNALVYGGYHDRVFLRHLVNDKGEEVINAKQVKLPGEDFYFYADQNRPYIMHNLSSRVSEVLAERAFAEGLAVTVPEGKGKAQDAITVISAANNLRALHVQACTQGSWAGDALYELYFDAARKRIGVSIVSPDRCFPDLDQLDPTRAVAWNIDQVLWLGKDNPFLWRKRHEMRGEEGWILNRLYRMVKDAAGLHVDFETDEVDLATHPTTALIADQYELPTGVRGLLVVHVPNKPGGMEWVEDGGKMVQQQTLWGASDYSYDLLMLQGDINDRLTQRAGVIRKQADPWVVGPFQADETGGVSAHHKMMKTDGSGGQVQVIAWDASMVAVADHIKDVTRGFAMTAGVDVATLTPREANGGPASGRALRLEQMNTQGTVQAKQSDAEGPLKELYARAVQLAAAQPAGAIRGLEGSVPDIDPDEITLGFGDGLPTMSSEDAEEQEMLLTAGLTTRKKALVAVHKVSEQDAEKLATEIEAAQAARMPQVPLVAMGSGIRRMVPGETEE